MQDNHFPDILEDLRKLLLEGANTTQETLCIALENIGHHVNQSKVSRLLRKLNAIKVKNDNGEMIYYLPHDAAPASAHSKLSELVIDIVANETIIVIKTAPGAASLLARMIDYKKCQILGTIAGDDTIFVAPISVTRLDETMTLIRRCLAD